MLKAIFNWIMNLFSKSETPVLDQKIKDKKKKIKDIDKELEKEYTDIDTSMDEWE